MAYRSSNLIRHGEADEADEAQQVDLYRHVRTSHRPDRPNCGPGAAICGEWILRMLSSSKVVRTLSSSMLLTLLKRLDHYEPRSKRVIVDGGLHKTHLLNQSDGSLLFSTQATKDLRI